MRDVGRGCTAAAGGRNGQGCCDDGGDRAAGAGGRQLLHDVDILRHDHDQQVVDGQIRRKIEARVEARAARSHLYHPVARVMTEVPPAAPRRQRAVWAARRVTRPPALGTAAAEQRRKEPSRPTRRQVEMTRVTLPDGRLGPSSLTIHTRLSGRPQAAVTAATVPLALYSASSRLIEPSGFARPWSILKAHGTAVRVAVGSGWAANAFLYNCALYGLVAM